MNQRNHRASMMLYSEPLCPFGHQVRLMIHEKNIDCEINLLNEAEWPEEVAAANPYGQGPTLFDRDVTLFDARIILEYFDERFPHPPLMPSDPASRAQVRLMLLRIYQDWYSLWPELSANREKSKMTKAKKRLREDLTVLSPLFKQSRFFMSDDMTLLDCSIAPLLWRLPQLGISLPSTARAIETYSESLFKRKAFQASLTDAERTLR